MKQLRLVINRSLWILPTLFGLVLLTFVISHVIPADPAAVVAGENASKELVAELRHSLGYDRPLYVQFLDYLWRVGHLDFGTSLYSTRPIASDLLGRLPATIELGLTALALTIVVGIPLGVVSALHRNSLLDHTLRMLTMSGLAIASFWLGIMLQLLLAMRLGWIPLTGRIDMPPAWSPTGFYLVDSLLSLDKAAFLSALLHLLLPAVTLAIPAIATAVRFTRAGVLDVSHSNFVAYERAMGLPEFLINWKYILRNAVTATVAQLGLIMGALLSGAVVVETVFDWPGIGNYAVQSITMSDYNAILGFTIWAGLIVMAVNVGVDLIQSLVDPRTRAQ